jgi:hypothetical protein
MDNFVTVASLVAIGAGVVVVYAFIFYWLVEFGSWLGRKIF